MKKYSLKEYIKRHLGTLVQFLTFTKSINIFMALSEFKLKKIKCVSQPFMYKIDIITLCNLKCVLCKTHSTKTDEKRIMDLNDYLIILDKLKKYSLRFSLYDLGEPLVHKDIYKMIQATSKAKISTLISTNFNLFRENDLNDLFNSKLTVLEPCLDGFTQKSYEKYRVGGDVEVVKNMIGKVMKYKHENNYKYPFVDVQVIEFDHIKNEIPLINKYLKSVKVDRITLRAEFAGFNSKKTSFKYTKKEGTCYWLYFGMVISPDGNVYSCSGRAFNGFSFGNILEEDLDEIWNNKYYQFARKIFTNGPEVYCTEDMLKIPCLSCRKYKLRRKIILEE